MSGTQPQYPVSDPVLTSLEGGMWIPQNDLTVDPQYGSVRMISPIGRLGFVNLARPKQVKQPDGSMGQPIFSLTILLNPNACSDLYRAIVAVATARFAPEQKPDPTLPLLEGGRPQLRTYSAEELLFMRPEQGGLHYPLRLGSESYMRDPVKYEQWRELFFINASLPATDTKGGSQRPVTFDEQGQLCDPSKLFSGCYASAQLTFFPYPKAGAQGRGSRGVGVSVNGVRFYRTGDPLGTFDAAKSAASAWAAAGQMPRATPPVQQPMVNDGVYGPNSGQPGMVPPGVGVPGFAQPQPQPQGYPQGYQPPTQPQQGYQPAPPGGIPPQQPAVPGYVPMARPPG